MAVYHFTGINNCCIMIEGGGVLGIVVTKIPYTCM